MSSDTFPLLFIFGEYTDGFVDISNGETDVLTHVKREEAEKLITERDQLLKRIADLEHQLRVTGTTTS